MIDNRLLSQMLKVEGWDIIEEIIERAKIQLLTADKDTVEEKRIVYQTLENLKNELIDKLMPNPETEGENNYAGGNDPNP